MSTNSWPPFNIRWQLFILMLIINKKFSVVLTNDDSSNESVLSKIKYFNNDVQNIKEDKQSELGKAWPMLSELYYNNNYEDYLPVDNKRSWHSLRGPWGKRLETNYNENDNIDLVQNDMADSDISACQLKMVNYLTRSAILNSLYDQILNGEHNNILSISDWHSDVMPEKREWKNLKHVWGKRDKKYTSWNNFHNVWGKRDSNNWNNLKGMWGKRTIGKWQNPSKEEKYLQPYYEAN